MTTIKKTSALLALIAAAIGSIAGTASAVNTTFDFTNPGYLQSPLSSVSAPGFDTVTQTSQYGLGVHTPVILDFFTATRVNFGEYVQFNFSQAVSLDSITLTDYQNDLHTRFGNIPFSGDNPVFSVSNDGSTWSAPIVTSNSSVVNLAGFYPNTVSFLRVGAHDIGDVFGIANLTVDYTPQLQGDPRDPPATPLPSSFFGGIALLSVLGIIAHRRRKMHCTAAARI